jgi:hypothetical protein
MAACSPTGNNDRPALRLQYCLGLHSGTFAGVTTLLESRSRARVTTRFFGGYVGKKSCRQWLGAVLVLLVAVAVRATPVPAPSVPPQVVATPPAVLALPGNLVANGDFETGSFSPQWTLSPGGPFDQVCLTGTPIGAATCQVHSGQYAMSFGLAGAQDSLTQSIPTVAGARYTLTFYLTNNNPLDQNTTTFAVLWDGNTVYSLASPQPTFPYQQVTLSVTATTSLTTLTFAAQHDPSQWFLDDVSVVRELPSAPIPTLGGWTQMLIALLLGGIAVRQIRRRPRTADDAPTAK